ncbi:MAG TPA: acyltransferase family protein [Micromonosporaceae bacterium]
MSDMHAMTGRPGKLSGTTDRQQPLECSAAPTKRFRADVEGLRAVAVGLVLLFHAGLPFLPGGYVGVDVFFVISGFLITTQLVAELTTTGKVSLVDFYARRAKRLLPAAAIVLVVTAALTRLVLPKIRWEEIGWDIVASSLYVINWRLADRSVDYLAEDSQPSPVQHFWSLAVEEQFYLVWPVLILAAALVARMIGLRVRPVLWLGLAAVAVPSFAWSVIETARSPQEAFFVTTTRMWELAIGAAVALGAAWWGRIPRAAGALLGWGGLVAIVASGLVFTNTIAWPGYAAALPTLGAAAVIVAGFSAMRSGPVLLLGIRPFQWVGKLSYSLYLWHWPLVVVATAKWGALSARSGLAVVAFSVIPAWLAFRFVENPVRHSQAVSRSPRLALSLGGNFTLSGVVLGLVLSFGAVNTVHPVSVGEHRALGAQVLGEHPRNHPAGVPPRRLDWITPHPLQAVKDVPDQYRDECHQNEVGTEVMSCVYGNPTAKTTVAVVGDSKAGQWVPALQKLADQNDWKLMVFTKSSCIFTTATIPIKEKPYESCVEWNRKLLDRLIRVERPDYVITSQHASYAYRDDGTLSIEEMVRGLRESWSALSAIGTKVIVIADNPNPGFNVYQCVEENRSDLTACTFSREVRNEQSGYRAQSLAVKGQNQIKMIDLYDAICPTDQCSPVIGNVLVYRQTSHLTATYVKTLTPMLARKFTEVGLRADFDPNKADLHLTS